MESERRACAQTQRSPPVPPCNRPLLGVQELGDTLRTIGEIDFFT